MRVVYVGTNIGVHQANEEWGPREDSCREIRSEIGEDFESKSGHSDSLAAELNVGRYPARIYHSL